jgi:ribosomal protein S18 acetylase RimI-like enzyme
MSAPNISVRQARLDDENAVAAICLKTAASGEDATGLYSREDMPGLVWAVPYLYASIEHCFVAQIDGEVVGYMVTTPDSFAFQKWLNAQWRKEFDARLKGFEAQTDADKNALRAAAEHRTMVPDYAQDYPAHLHINLLPEAQGTGLGRKLMDAACDKLIADNVIGLHLGVAEKNVKAIGFYQAMGFKRLTDQPGYVMAKKLGES